MLKEDENRLIAKLIGFVKVLDGDGIKNNEEEFYRNAFDAINKEEDLNPYIDKIMILKDIYMPHCKTCSHPCGRGDDYFLNSENSDIKFGEYNKLKTNYKNMSFKDMEYTLMSLTWI